MDYGWGHQAPRFPLVMLHPPARILRASAHLNGRGGGWEGGVGFDVGAFGSAVPPVTISLWRTLRHQSTSTKSRTANFPVRSRVVSLSGDPGHPPPPPPP
eukprot:Hpha_TRINITY_DN13039_c0_g2::TRINITY_DN13039_c0_g2_i1::g.69086::m.69086